jgi:hypothetical protein
VTLVARTEWEALIRAEGIDPPPMGDGFTRWAPTGDPAPGALSRLVSTGLIVRSDGTAVMVTALPTMEDHGMLKAHTGAGAFARMYPGRATPLDAIGALGWDAYCELLITGPPSRTPPGGEPRKK